MLYTDRFLLSVTRSTFNQLPLFLCNLAAIFKKRRMEMRTIAAVGIRMGYLDVIGISRKDNWER